MVDLKGYKVYWDTAFNGYTYNKVADVLKDTSYTITDLSPGKSYHIAVTCYDNSGNESQYSTDTVVTTLITGLDIMKGAIPDKFMLFQNYPNPFNPTTTISFALPLESKIEISIYNILGQEIKQLANLIESAGYHEITFNANNLASGIYFYRITAISTDGKREFNEVKRLVLLK